MAILVALLALGSRFTGRILMTALGWASALLFGRVPVARQRLLLGVAFGSVIWLVLVAGIFLPALGTFLLLLVPPQSLIPDVVLRLAMLAGVILVPAVVGVFVVALEQNGPTSMRRVTTGVLRGYPLTVVLAVLLVFLAGLSTWRKIVGLRRGWTDAHVPFVVDPGAYDQVAIDLERAIEAAGIAVGSRLAPASMSTPAIWLGKVAGSAARGLVPDRMVRLSGADLDIIVFPMDALISGHPAQVARARAAIASRLTTSAAHLTVSSEAQALEDRIAGLVSAGADDGKAARFDEVARERLDAIDLELASIQVSYDEWETLYRRRLQVERDLRARSMADGPMADGPIVDTKPERAGGA